MDEKNEEINNKELDKSELGFVSNTKNKQKEKYHIGLIIIIALLIFIIVGMMILIIYLFKNGSLNVGNDISSNNKIELKYTETNTVNSDGVYITDVSDVVLNVMPSIVAITSKTLISTGRYGPSYFGSSQYSEGAGSGIIISKSDAELIILTNNHVVEGAEELTVKFINDKIVDAKIKGTSERKDIAIITINLSDLDEETLNSIKIATLGDSDSLKVGNGVIAIGNALGYGQSVTTGVVSALNREVTIDNYTNEMIQIDAAINGGNSGGALLNSNGEVIGINSAKYSSTAFSSSVSIEGMGFAIPISDIVELIEKLMNGEEDNGAVLGIQGYMISKSSVNTYNLPVGFYISAINPDSGASKAGLEIGNIITEIDGKTVETFSDLSNVLYEKKAGDSVTLKVKYASGSEYKEKEVKVILS